VFALGLGDRLAAVTHECDRRSRDIHTHISTALHGGSSIYLLDHNLLHRLAPDLILTQELCDVCAVSYETVAQAVRRLQRRATILSREPTTFQGILDTIRQVGQATGTSARAATLVREHEGQIDTIAGQARTASGRPASLRHGVVGSTLHGRPLGPRARPSRWGPGSAGPRGIPLAQVSWRRITDYDPEVIVLMPCGFTLDRTREEFVHLTLPEEWSDLSAVQSGRVYAVNGSAYFNRPGPRIVMGLQILAEIIHPEVFARTTPPEAWQRLAD
jgi:iron complex transport system substrate-binding protein